MKLPLLLKAAEVDMLRVYRCRICAREFAILRSDEAHVDHCPFLHTTVDGSFPFSPKVIPVEDA